MIFDEQVVNLSLLDHVYFLERLGLLNLVACLEEGLGLERADRTEVEVTK